MIIDYNLIHQILKQVTYTDQLHPEINMTAYSQGKINFHIMEMQKADLLKQCESENGIWKAKVTKSGLDFLGIMNHKHIWKIAIADTSPSMSLPIVVGVTKKAAKQEITTFLKTLSQIKHSIKTIEDENNKLKQLLPEVINFLPIPDYDADFIDEMIALQDKINQNDDPITSVLSRIYQIIRIYVIKTSSQNKEPTTCIQDKKDEIRHILNP